MSCKPADAGGRQNYPLPISNGILEHRAKIGAAIWLFILLIDWTTSEENGVGKVLGGKPIKLRDLMGALYLRERQVSSQLQRLKAGGYIRLRRSSYGYSIEVMKSKKFVNRDRQKIAGLPTSDQQFVADLDQQKTADHNGQTSRKLPIRSATFCRNKEDITVDLTKRDSAKGKPSRSNGSDPRVREFFDYWQGEYRNRVGESYVTSWEKEGAQIKRVLGSHDLPRLKTLASAFLDSSDPWIQQRGGYTIGVFVSQINKLVSTSKAAVMQPRKVMPL